MTGLHRYYKIWNNLFKPIDALNCIGGDKCNKMFYGECRIYQFLLPLKMLSFCAVPTIYNRILQRLLLKALLRLEIVLKNNTITLIFLFAGYSLVMNVNKFFFIDQDTYWTQPNGCLSSDMFYLDKLHPVEKGNIVLAKSICKSMEYSPRIITKNEFKTSYKLATDFPVLSSKYVCKAVCGCTKVPPSKFISNAVTKSLRKFVFVCKFVSVPMFAQSIHSPSYRVVKRSDFDLFIKVNINTRCSVSVCRKVRKSVLVSVSTNVFHTPAPDVVNVTIASPYQHFSSTKNVSKSVLSVSAVSFIPAPTLTVNPVMSLHGRSVLASVNTTCRVHNVSPYIPLSVNTSTPLVNYVSHNVHHVQHLKCESFKSVFPNKIENVIVEMHLPKTKPIKTLNENFAKLDRTNKETYTLGDNGTIMVNILYVKITP